MGIVTTYVCDVSGVTGPKDDFHEVKVISTPLSSGAYQSLTVVKHVHKDVALKLHLLRSMPSADVPPEPTIESKLTTVLKEYISDLAYEAGEEGASNYLSHRG